MEKTARKRRSEESPHQARQLVKRKTQSNQWWPRSSLIRRVEIPCRCNKSYRLIAEVPHRCCSLSIWRNQSRVQALGPSSNSRKRSFHWTRAPERMLQMVKNCLPFYRLMLERRLKRTADLTVAGERAGGVKGKKCRKSSLRKANCKSRIVFLETNSRLWIRCLIVLSTKKSNFSNRLGCSSLRQSK